MNLHIANQLRQDYPFKRCQTIEEKGKGNASYFVNCSPQKNNYKIPNKKEEQTIDCFRKVPMTLFMCL